MPFPFLHNTIHGPLVGEFYIKSRPSPSSANPIAVFSRRARLQQQELGAIAYAN